jgi:hypothetical protein
VTIVFLFVIIGLNMPQRRPKYSNNIPGFPEPAGVSAELNGVLSEAEWAHHFARRGQALLSYGKCQILTLSVFLVNEKKAVVTCTQMCKMKVIVRLSSF